MPESVTSPRKTLQDGALEPALTSLFRATVGPINSDYYLPIFTRFEAAGRTGPSWNGAASLYTLNWLVFRHLWMAALIYLTVVVIVPLLTLSLGRLVFQWSETLEFLVGLVALILLFVVPGVWGNVVYYQVSRQRMATALAASATLEEACARLRTQSSSRHHFFQILVANAALACIAIPLGMMLSKQKSPAPARVPVSLAMSPALPVVPASASLSAPGPAVVPASAPLSAPAPALAVAAGLASAPAVVTSSRIVADQTPILPKPAAAVSAVPAVLSPVPKMAVSKPAEGQRFYVNVGLFADAGNAAKALRKVQTADLPTLSRVLQTPKGPLTRVRAGPFDSRAEADAAASQIKALALDAAVVQQ